MWIDQFAAFKLKTTFLAVINIFKALGVNGGILLNHFVGGENYKTSFLIESLTLLALGFVFVPLIFILIGGFGIIVYRRSFISYKNGTYSFGDLFRTHHLNNGEFDKIVCKLYLPQKVYFLNEKSEIVLKLRMEIRYIGKAKFLEFINPFIDKISLLLCLCLLI